MPKQPDMNSTTYVFVVGLDRITVAELIDEGFGRDEVDVLAQMEDMGYEAIVVPVSEVSH